MTTTQIPTVTETDRELAAMFTENTGRHMLDSGGAYGRNWERNTGRDAESFLAEPEASIEVWSESDWYLTRSTFHFLRERLEWDADLNAELDTFAELNPDENWFWVAENFPAYHAELHDLDAPDETNAITVNTYNHESLLDQTLQFVQVNHDGEGIYPEYVVLQVHGGCDVRGGYTRPKVFLAAGCGEVGLLDDTSIAIGCTGSTPSPDEVLPGFVKPEVEYHSWSSDDAGYNWYPANDEPELTREATGQDEDGNLLCPVCGSRLEAYAY